MSNIGAAHQACLSLQVPVRYTTAFLSPLSKHHTPLTAFPLWPELMCEGGAEDTYQNERGKQTSANITGFISPQGCNPSLKGG